MLIDESRDEPGHVVATKCTRICVKSGPWTIIEALKNVKLPSGLVGRAWVMKPKKKKGKKRTAAEPAAVFDTIAERISSLRKINGSIGVRSSRTTTRTWYSSQGIIARWENTISRTIFSLLLLVVRLSLVLLCLPPFHSASIWKSYYFPYEAFREHSSRMYARLTRKRVLF